ncbi:hypothetical protein [Mesomycoplasma flocculare]|uniref:Uncharacterized protein n=3 Tax=Mesomycoplasma flocculare TaxID=2128 RepID=A0A0A8E6Q2_MESFC|nr:hypothetical protein [Mesomycoplasma flocculare]AJC49915.1 hypothetical protein MYF_02055 [Mesomycoplasma flocculare ATCC 27399]
MSKWEINTTIKKRIAKLINYLTFQAILMVVFPSVIVSCSSSKIPQILLQNLQSRSVEFVLDNVELMPQEDVSKSFKIELRKENAENYQKTKFSARRALHNNQPKILLKITNLEPNSKYAIKISHLEGENEKQLFIRGNVFQTKPNPSIISNSFKKINSQDPSSQYDFKVALSDSSLSSQNIYVHYRKANMIRANHEIQSFVHNIKSDQFLYVSLKNLERDTNYIISGLYNQKGDLLTFDNNLFPLLFRTDADIVGIEVSNSKFPGQIDQNLENIDVEFLVKFSPGIVKSNNVNNYSLVFKRENDSVSTGFDQVNEKDVEYIANYVRPADKGENSFIFAAKFPWGKQHNFYKIVGGFNKLARDSHLFDQNIVDSANILKINQSVLAQRLQIDA